MTIPSNDGRVALIAQRLLVLQQRRPLDAERVEMVELARWVLKQPSIQAALAKRKVRP
jgi:hypothetical protein